MLESVVIIIIIIMHVLVFHTKCHDMRYHSKMLNKGMELQQALAFLMGSCKIE